MRVPTLLGKLCLLICVFAVSGCGGGGGGGGGAAPVLLATLQSLLQAANETHPVTIPGAQGAAVIEIRSDGEIRFSITVQEQYRAAVDAAHIHRGAAGVPGGIEVDLDLVAVPDDGTLTVSGTVQIAPALAQEIAAMPGDFYVNVHTTDDPDGLVRNQLAPFAPLQWHATQLSSEEVPPFDPDPDERGAATLHVTAPDTIRYVIALGTHDIDAQTVAHIHAGDAGVAGPIVVNLTGAPDTTRDTDLRTITGTVTIPRSVLTRILADRAGFYVNTHTQPDAPNGLVRGQLAEGPIEMWALLTNDRETPDPFPAQSFTGGATVSFDTFTQGDAVIAVPPGQGNGLDDVTDAHIHEGDEGEPGGIVIPLLNGADLNLNPASGTAESTIVYTQELLTRILARPEGFYFNVHTDDAPNGLVRNQLGRNPETYFADLDPGNTETLRCIFTGVFGCSFTLQSNAPAVGDITAAAIREASSDFNLIDLLGGESSVVGNTISGNVVFTGRTFARFLASPDQFYVFAASDAVAVGGTPFRITDEDPPAGLVYFQNPAVYQTTVKIVPNFATSSGGAVSEYSIDPALPAGLDFCTSTGLITGTPDETSGPTVHTVTASNAVGETTADLTITVEVGAPAGLQYDTPVTYVQNTLIDDNVPTSTGGEIESYAIDPALPAGLTLDTDTGIISGTPTGTSDETTYTVTATNDTGETTADVVITVTEDLEPPSNLHYTDEDVTYTTGYAITDNVPSNDGGDPTSYSITAGGALPSGLALDTGTGIISGTPTQVKSATTYTIRAENAAGFTTVDVTITVDLGVPGPFTYSNENVVGYVGYTIGSITPTHDPVGGAVDTYSISPALPAGLSINAGTGVISGTPTESKAETTYTITATNDAGSETRDIKITIL